jgi:hypothetical protein
VHEPGGLPVAVIAERAQRVLPVPPTFASRLGVTHQDKHRVPSLRCAFQAGLVCIGEMNIQSRIDDARLLWHITPGTNPFYR